MLLSIALSLSPLLAQADWTHQAPLPTGLDLRGVHAVSPTEVWAIGDDGVLVHSIDGGSSWSVHDLDSESMWALFFLDASHGWAVGNGFFHTTDGGATWVKDNSWGTIHDVRFRDPLRGWARFSLEQLSESGISRPRTTT